MPQEYRSGKFLVAATATPWVPLDYYNGDGRVQVSVVTSGGADFAYTVEITHNNVYDQNDTPVEVFALWTTGQGNGGRAVSTSGTTVVARAARVVTTFVSGSALAQIFINTA